MKNEARSFLTVSTIAGLIALAIGCGKSDAPPIGAVGGGVSGPQTQVSFSENCTSKFGQLIILDGKQVCRHTVMPAMQFPTNFIRLNPDDPSGPYAWDTGVDVKSGDSISYSTAGFWGERNVSSGEWDIFGWVKIPYTTASCGMVNVLGQKQDGFLDLSLSQLPLYYKDLPLYQDLPPGLVASDGTEVFMFAGNGMKNIRNDGRLRVGFNIPPGVGSCTQSPMVALNITRCEDGTGKTYSCPIF